MLPYDDYAVLSQRLGERRRRSAARRDARNGRDVDARRPPLPARLRSTVAYRLRRLARRRDGSDTTTAAVR